ncbi:metal ABC transporter substrate-binding protein [Simiduia sp. 21SJ11W-1]|uniref:metal ABC transporter substrate-binding protein n=1 Tax=Simiduia sp. 21SJ11W-1 TaxID=2909669 RepID=UPI00209CB1D6|nr:metal ABC transporter substrate-binding protein [Simiduia sp. 21SJ11W-1]UTA47770.1 metal ABC transporter substrate-binding protein [Simiduia sp. 21SJ11W-1]
MSVCIFTSARLTRPARLTARGLMALVLVALLGAAAAPAQSARVVASIEPLAMLAEPLLGPGDSLEVLLPPNRSPHHFALRASHLRMLQSADVVLWVGPILEPFLVKALQGHPAAEPLMDLPDMQWPEPLHQTEVGHHSHERDPHVWLNPDNGAVIVRWLAAQLMAQAPEQADAIAGRRDALLAQLAELAQSLKERLAPFAGRAFIAYHPAYEHFNARFGLTQRAFVALTPEQKPGARHLMDLQHEARGVQCLVTESFYDTQASHQLAAQLGLPFVVADPMGAALGPATWRYGSLLSELAGTLAGCLAGSGPAGPSLAVIKPQA